MEKLRALTAPKGTGSLLCLAPSPHDEGATLAAAGEDGAAVVFDLRGDSLVAHRLSADAGCFSAGDAVTSVAYARAREHLLYCASGCVVTAWDLRAVPVARAGVPAPDPDPIPADADAAAAAVARASIADPNDRAANDPAPSAGGPAHRYAFNDDEINAVSVSARGDALCAADDSGAVVVVDVSHRAGFHGKLVKRLRGGHENIASGAVFRHHRPWDVISGGLDCAVCKWDYSRGAPVAKWRVGELAAAEAAREAADAGDDAPAAPSQMCNPPFVHAVAAWNEREGGERSEVAAAARRLVAAACGDGTVALVDVDAPAPGTSGGTKKSGKKTKSKSKSKTTTNTNTSHTGGAEGGAEDGGPFGGTRRALFLGRAAGVGHASACSHATFPGWGGGALVLSGGNDRHVRLWDWRVAARELRGDRGGDGDGDAGRTGGLVLSLKHGRKVNWLACGAGTGECPGGGDTFVADTSERVSVYAMRR